MNWRSVVNWKVLGLAGAVGVAATGVVLARDERQRRTYTPEEVRARLHERLAATAPAPPPAPPPEPTSSGVRSWTRKVRRRGGSRRRR